MSNADRSDADPLPEAGPEQGGSPPALLPWTLVIEGEHGWSADLEHGAPVPRVDDRIEFIAENGERRTYRVTRIVHTVQPSASDRPPVHDDPSGPNATVSEHDADEPPRALRAGLPRVFAAREE